MKRPFPSTPTAPNRRRRKSKSFSLILTLSSFPMRILSAAKLIFRTLISVMRTVVKKMQTRMRIWRTPAVRTVRTIARCAKNVCVRTSAESNVLPPPSTEFGYPSSDGRPNSLVRGLPLKPRKKDDTNSTPWQARRI